MIRTLFVFLMLIIGCNDYDLHPYVEDPIPGVDAPEIEVDPLSHNFGALVAGTDESDVIVTIQNNGTDDLNIDDIYLHSGQSNFSIAHPPIGIIEPSESVELIVTYGPGTYETNSDIISILSNDDDEPEVQVFLDGSGDAPVIYVAPDYYDFGLIYLGCDDITEVEIGNMGNVDLTISDLEYFSSLPVDFSMQDYVLDYGLLPIVLPPGDSITLSVDYIPLDILDDSGYIEITSNDPVTPVAQANQEGLGDYESWTTDQYTQDNQGLVDILFVIDNSGSMGSNQTNLKNNFDAFMAAFIAAGVDYHIGIITTDTSDFIGDVITISTPDPLTEFNDQIDSATTTGSAIEQGLLKSYEATSGTGDAAPGAATGFFRDSARLVIVYVSDEPDYSSYSSSMSFADYSTHLLSLKSSSALVVAHAVAGDYPSGCSANGGAQFGNGYHDVVTDLGGTYMSICADDWNVTMDTLAQESLVRFSFGLTGDPIEDSIEVTVDGTIETGWVYDTSANSVVFNSAPSETAVINITYANWGTCE